MSALLKNTSSSFLCFRVVSSLYNFCFSCSHYFSPSLVSSLFHIFPPIFLCSSPATMTGSTRSATSQSWMPSPPAVRQTKLPWSWPRCPTHASVKFSTPPFTFSTSLFLQCVLQDCLKTHCSYIWTFRVEKQYPTYKYSNIHTLKVNKMCFEQSIFIFLTQPQTSKIRP